MYDAAERDGWMYTPHWTSIWKDPAGSGKNNKTTQLTYSTLWLLLYRSYCTFNPKLVNYLSYIPTTTVVGSSDGGSNYEYRTWLYYHSSQAITIVQVHSKKSRNVMWYLVHITNRCQGMVADSINSSHDEIERGGPASIPTRHHGASFSSKCGAFDIFVIW